MPTYDTKSTRAPSGRPQPRPTTGKPGGTQSSGRAQRAPRPTVQLVTPAEEVAAEKDDFGDSDRARVPVNLEDTGGVHLATERDPVTGQSPASPGDGESDAR